MATLADLVADDSAVRYIVMQIEAYDTVNEVGITLYFSEQGYASKPTDTPPSEYFFERVTIGLNSSCSMWQSGTIGGVSLPSWSRIELDNIDGDLDELEDYSIDGRRIRCWLVGRLSDGTEVTLANVYTEPVFDGYGIDNFDVSANVVRFEIRDSQRLLEEAVQRNVLRGTNHCLSFDGVNDLASVGSFTSTEATTFECWFRCTGDNDGPAAQVIANHNDGTFSATHIDWYIQITTSGLLQAIIHRKQASPVTLNEATTDFRDSQWHHVALVLNSGTNGCKLYVDGVLVDQDTEPTFAALTGNVLISATLSGDTTNNLKGEIDEVRFWNIARGQDEIQDNMFREIDDPVNPLTLHGYYRLNTNTGTSISDESNNGKTGTITGATWAGSYTGRNDVRGVAEYRTFGVCYNIEPTPVDPTRNAFKFFERSPTYLTMDGTSGTALNKRSRIGGVTTVRSNMNPIAAANWSADLDRGVLTLTGNPGGRITMDLFGECQFPSSMYFGGGAHTSFGDTQDQTTSFTLEAWIRADLVSGLSASRRIFDKDNATTGWFLGVNSATGSEGQLTFTIRGGSTATSAVGDVPLGKWCHVAAVYDTAANTMTLYINGIQVGQTTSVTVDPAGTAHTFAIGRRASDSGGPFVGAITEARVWTNVVRTQAQIREWMFKPLIGNESGLTGYWRCHDRAGTTVTATVGANGTMTAAGWTSGPCSAALLAYYIGAGLCNITSWDYDLLCGFHDTVPGDCHWVVKDTTTTYHQLLDRIVGGVRGFFTSSRSNQVLCDLFRLPTSSPDLDLDGDIDVQVGDIEAISQQPPIDLISCAYRQNWTVLDPGSIAGIVTTQPDAYAFAISQWRYETSRRPATRTPYLKPREITIETPFVNADDAKALASQQLEMWSVKRVLRRVPAFVRPFTVNLNDQVRITNINRLGLEAAVLRIFGFTETPEGAKMEVFK